MSDNYLWDRSGRPDSQVERLERLLAPLAHRGEFRQPPKPAAPARWLAAAAAVLVIAAAAWQLGVRPASTRTSWAVVGSATALHTGQVLRTGSGQEISLRADDLGEIDLAPDSELRIAGHQRLALPRGRIHVLIWAPPRRFVVDTPSARAIDLGCQYTLAVDPAGDGMLKVETGWVAFQFQGRESFIPEGAECRTSRRGGPGTPYFSDAPPALRAALEEFDRAGSRAALGRVLAQARPRDGLTLWHLLARVPEADRGAVFDRFAALVKLPPEVTRAGIQAREPRLLDLCWNALNLEDTEWWREWKRPWQP